MDSMEYLRVAQELNRRRGSLLNASADGILYHYTTQEGLLGILKDRAVRATRIEYLNDAREFIHARDLFVSVLQERLAVGDGDVRRDLTSLLAIFRQPRHVADVFVFSLSTDGDQLSQWRAYGGKASGFAIGFPGTVLVDRFRGPAKFAPCVYRPSEQRELIDEFVEAGLYEAGLWREQRQTDPAGEENFQTMALGGFVGLAPFLKDASFHEEGEWRATVQRVATASEPQVKLRAGSSMLIPYVDLPLTRDPRTRVHGGGDWTNEIVQVVVGPTPHPALSVQSVRNALDLYGLPECAVRRSDIPYRNW